MNERLTCNNDCREKRYIYAAETQSALIWFVRWSLPVVAATHWECYAMWLPYLLCALIYRAENPSIGGLSATKVCRKNSRSPVSRGRSYDIGSGVDHVNQGGWRDNLENLKSKNNKEYYTGLRLIVCRHWRWQRWSDYFVSWGIMNAHCHWCSLHYYKIAL